jgi:hypothetical protein
MAIEKGYEYIEKLHNELKEEVRTLIKERIENVIIGTAACALDLGDLKCWDDWLQFQRITGVEEAIHQIVKEIIQEFGEFDAYIGSDHILSAEFYENDDNECELSITIVKNGDFDENGEFRESDYDISVNLKNPKSFEKIQIMLKKVVEEIIDAA